MFIGTGAGTGAGNMLAGAGGVVGASGAEADKGRVGETAAEDGTAGGRFTEGNGSDVSEFGFDANDSECS